jgi:hypothetical protein
MFVCGGQLEQTGRHGRAWKPPPVYLRPFCEQPLIQSPKANAHARQEHFRVCQIRSALPCSWPGSVLVSAISCCSVEGDMHALHPTRVGAWQNRHCTPEGALFGIPRDDYYTQKHSVQGIQIYTVLFSFHVSCRSFDYMHTYIEICDY